MLNTFDYPSKALS